MFAIVKISGKQYKVAPNDVVTVDKIDGDVGETVTLHDVLVVQSDTGTIVGTPTVTQAKIEAKIVSQGKGEKISVRRYKQKVRYRKANGFRAHETTLQVVKIHSA